MRWIIVGLRTALTWIVGIVATVVAATAVFAIALFKDTSPLIDRTIRAWSRVWLVVAGAPLTIEGQENIDPERSYVVVSNHLSSLDIMTCLLATQLPIRFLAKKELFRIPILAQGMNAVGIIKVDRAARGAVHAKVNREAKVLIKKKRSLIIYPEGTRPRNGAMKRFKKGAFTMAIASELPILPMSIYGTYEAWKPGSPWVTGGPIGIVIDPPIETVGLEHSDTGALRDEVEQLIGKRVLEMGGRVASVQS